MVTSGEKSNYIVGPLGGETMRSGELGGYVETKEMSGGAYGTIEIKTMKNLVLDRRHGRKHLPLAFRMVLNLLSLRG
jgi:hypothetical protein